MGLRSSNYFTQVLPVCMASWKNKFFSSLLSSNKPVSKCITKQIESIGINLLI